MAKEKQTMTPPPQTPQTPAPATRQGCKTGKPRKQDTREPHVIFAERFNTEARLLVRRFQNLAGLGSAKRAKPTQAQLEHVQKWLREQTEECLADMGRKLRAQEAPAADNKPFAVLPEAPAKVQTSAAAAPAAAPVAAKK